VAELTGQISDSFDGRPQDCEFSFLGDELFVLQTRDVTASLPVETPPFGPWTPPGKGAWELDENHFTRPVTKLFAERFPAAMMRGFKSSTARYGALLSHGDIEFVNGFMYMRMRPVAAPEDATTKDPPPPFVFKLLCRVIPELRRRIKTASRIWEDREWRRQAEEWEVAKQASIEAHLALQNVDLTALDDAALIDHLRAVDAHVERMIEQHHSYNMATLIPTGDLLAHAAQWSDDQIAPTDVLALLAGASAVSADLRSPEAQQLAKHVAESESARLLLRLSDSDATITDIAAAQALKSLCALENEAGRCARTFLAHREYRLIEGLDPAAPCLRELPAVLWRAVRNAALHANEAPQDDAEYQEILQRCRDAIAPEHYDTFNALLAEARATYHLRDERSLYSDVWAWGILRTACLEVGARLFRRSPPRIVEPVDAVQASVDELDSLLLQGQGPSAQELRRRGAFQNGYTTEDAPALLGASPKPPPPSDILPPGVARVTDAVMTVIALVLPGRGEAPSEDIAELAGRPASGGVYEGVAHIVASPKDVDNLSPGAVLVVGASSSSFTMLAPLAAAVIAEGGGLLSHVAIVCREYRIPCVCGCVGVLERLQSGDRVRVDGTRGTVALLDRLDRIDRIEPIDRAETAPAP
jgi:pyruvate,water dikinase